MPTRRSPPTRPFRNHTQYSGHPLHDLRPPNPLAVDASVPSFQPRPTATPSISNRQTAVWRFTCGACNSPSIDQGVHIRIYKDAPCRIVQSRTLGNRIEKRATDETAETRIITSMKKNSLLHLLATAMGIRPSARTSLTPGQTPDTRSTPDR